MAKRKVSNLLALAVLSLLSERPMYAYEALTIMRQRELFTVVKLNHSSLYSVMDSLSHKGLIEAVETQREGRYPERTTYSTTNAGKEELLNWLRSILRKPATEYTQLAAGLAFFGHLPPQEVATLLEEHEEHLSKQIKSTHNSIERGHGLGVDRLFLIEEEYVLTLLEAKHKFIEQLIHDVKDGKLTEERSGQIRWKADH